MRFNPVTGFEQFTCPFCGSFLSIQPYIDLISDDVYCKAKHCQQIVNIPSLVSLETDSKPFHPAQLRCGSRLLPNGRHVSRLVPDNKFPSPQLNLFGGVL
jgi:hypothetical protein